MDQPSPATQFWATIEAMIARAIDEHLQSHHAPEPEPPPSFQTHRPEQSDLIEDDPKAQDTASRVLAGRSGPPEAMTPEAMHIPITTGALHIPIAVNVDDQEIAAMVATKLKTYQSRLDHVAAQTGPPGYRDLDPDALRAFRERLAHIGARETCPLCDVDYWAARWQSSRSIAKVCLCCGFIAYFDSAVVGVMPPGRPPDKGAL